MTMQHETRAERAKPHNVGHFQRRRP
jgi:hypothetical protein